MPPTDRQTDRQRSTLAEKGSESSQQTQTQTKAYISAQWSSPFSFNSYANDPQITCSLSLHKAPYANEKKPCKNKAEGSKLILTKSCSYQKEVKPA